MLRSPTSNPAGPGHDDAVRVDDGPTLGTGEIIAPAAEVERADEHSHNNDQDPEAFLRSGGFRGRRYVPLTDVTYLINRWFAAVELIPKSDVPIGCVGVVVSYYGRVGRDLSGAALRHGERVAEGERGVLERPMGPGKYPFNTYAGNIVLVPTTNFVLHWVTGKTEAHRYVDGTTTDYHLRPPSTTVFSGFLHGNARDCISRAVVVSSIATGLKGADAVAAMGSS